MKTEHPWIANPEWEYECYKHIMFFTLSKTPPQQRVVSSTTGNAEQPSLFQRVTISAKFPPISSQRLFAGMSWLRIQSLKSESKCADIELGRVPFSTRTHYYSIPAPLNAFWLGCGIEREGLRREDLWVAFCALLVLWWLLERMSDHGMTTSLRPENHCCCVIRSNCCVEVSVVA